MERRALYIFGLLALCVAVYGFVVLSQVRANDAHRTGAIAQLQAAASASAVQTSTPPVPPTSTPALAAAPIASPPPVATGSSNKPLLGACGSCGGVAGVQQFEKFMGRKEDYVLVWGWADTLDDFTYSVHWIDQHWPALRYHLEWDMPMIVQGTTFQEAIDGTYDGAYLEWAKTIAARDPRATIRIGHEMNGTWYDWSQNGPAGSAAQFAAAYRHIVALFRTVSPDFKFVWNPGAGKWGGIDYLATYPGDAYVDYISYDQYEDSRYVRGTPEERWQHFLDNDGRGLTFLASFAAQHGKRMAFDEWASNYDDSAYIERMYHWMSSHNVAYQTYWDSEAAFSGSFAAHPANGAAFRGLFGK